MIELKLANTYLLSAYGLGALHHDGIVVKGLPKDALLVDSDIIYVDGIGTVLKLIFDCHDGDNEIHEMAIAVDKS